MEAIGGIFGIGKSMIGYYNAIIKDLAPDVLDIVENTFSNTFITSLENKNDDALEVNSNTLENIDWSFRWFQNITPLSHKHQRQIVDKIIANKGNVTTKQLQQFADMYKGRQAIETYFIEHVPSEHLDRYIASLDSGTYDQSVEYDKEAKEANVARLLSRLQGAGGDGDGLANG